MSLYYITVNEFDVPFNQSIYLTTYYAIMPSLISSTLQIKRVFVKGNISISNGDI